MVHPLPLNNQQKASRLIWFIKAHKHASEATSALANNSINVEQQQQKPSEPTLDYLAHLHTLITWFIARNTAQITHKSPNGKMGNSQTGLNQQHRKSLSLWRGRR
ncbi:hypothetical protein PCANC_28900 [Puccinia coronata f. sp. avenae]|uniref:Uncharacterized protein n=1 Tax=Puccinia coronata f. sp. avenae TaxID=200324 RepID=A0A2N5RUV7_9BASI|nr:hypothetical protein PCANC_28900 [Puccinia coronata f. sp. avenae]